MNEQEKREMILLSMNSHLKGTNLQEICRKNKGIIRFPMFLTDEMMREDIDSLEFSVRARNCLRRAGFHSIGALVEGIEGWEDLSKIRNCGRNSCQEIMMKLFFYQYTQLSKERQARYMNRVYELNVGGIDYE